MQSPSLMVRILKTVLRAVWVVLISRRQLNLPRWVRRPRFTDLHSTMVAWLDSHFAMVERGAPWLHRVGTDVWDSCKSAVHSPVDISFEPRFHASARCVRNVITVYGFDGDLAERLGQLDEALSVAGWERLRRSRSPELADANAHAVLHWRPNTALSYPPGMEAVPPWGKPPLAPTMWLSWVSRGQPSRLRQNPNRTHGSTRNYLAVESSGTEYWKLPDTALERHDHTLTVQIDLLYYWNMSALAWRHRIPRYLLPTPIAPYHGGRR